jgi:hypothetical protein
VTQLAAGSLGDVYELTLAGGVGPVLRKALRPFGTPHAHACTVVRAQPPPGVDLVDLLAALDAHGLQVEVIADDVGETQGCARARTATSLTHGG